MMASDAVVYRVAEIRAIEQRADPQNQFLIAEAGKAAWLFCTAQWPEARRILVMIGIGHNGSDGLIFAEHARTAGCQVTLISANPNVAHPFLGIDAPWPEADLIVDAIFGIGLNRLLSPQDTAWIERINERHVPIFSLDIPSGLHADTGIPLPTAIRATKTLTFIGLKPGIITGQGQFFSGTVTVAPLSITDKQRGNMHGVGYAYHQYASAPARPAHTHKGQCGHVLIIGGAPGFAGATLLAGRAALRSGAGKVSIATHPAHAHALAAHMPELMIHAVPDSQTLKPLLSQANIVVLGPGLQQLPWSLALWQATLESGLPLVLDADGLNILAAQSDAVLPEDTVLTPHPGEAARLLQCSNEQVSSDRLSSIQNLWARFERPVLLKGSGSLIKTDAAHYWVCTAGNPGMATAGMGDVLTGLIAGLMAQGRSKEQALRDGVALHATAGDEAARTGCCGLIASDLIDWIRLCHNHPSQPL